MIMKHLGQNVTMTGLHSQWLRSWCLTSSMTISAMSSEDIYHKMVSHFKTFAPNMFFKNDIKLDVWTR